MNHATIRSLLSVGAVSGLLFGAVACKKQADAKESTQTSPEPTAPSAPSPEDAHKVTALAGAYYNTYALLANGKVRAWGQAQHGQLGNGKATISSADDPSLDAATPVEVMLPSAAVSIAAGHPAVGQAGSQACALLDNQKAYCWGTGSPWPGAKGGDKDKPAEVPELNGAKQLSIGLGHGCALMGDASVKCWGGNYEGEAGGGKEQRDVKIPSVVKGLSQATAVTTGSSHSCAIAQQGKVFCWGRNSNGQAVPGADAKLFEPTLVPEVSEAIQLAANDDWTCALDSKHQMTCWGDRKPATKLASDVKQLAQNTGDHMCALKMDGQVICWGANNYGQAGSGQAQKPYTVATPEPVAGLKGAVAVGAGYEHSCAALNDGSVSCWGRNRFGELGDGTLKDNASPTKVKGANAVELAAATPGFDAAPQGSQPQSFDQLPKGCTHSASLEGKHQADLRGEFSLSSAVATIDKNGMVTVTLGNYDMLDDKNKLLSPRGDQLKTVLYFLHIKDPNAKQEERLPTDKGDYVVSGKKAARYLGAMSAINNSHHGFYVREGAHDNTVFKLDYIGQDYVCGQITLDHKYGKLQGSFAAKVI